jgi:hypothetical protein
VDGEATKPAGRNANGGDVLVRHGYTVVDLDELARRAALDTWQWTPWPFGERKDIARFAIIEHLLTCAQPPDFWRLVKLGKRAIQANVYHEAHHRGVSVARAGQSGGAPLPHFVKYWSSAGQHTRSPEDLIVDPLALAQIWPRPAPSHQTALLALAAHGDYEQAAASLTKTYRTFFVLISMACKEFFRLWHQGETPSRMWGRDRRKRQSPGGSPHHSITVVTIRRHERRRRGKQAEGRARSS